MKFALVLIACLCSAAAWGQNLNSRPYRPGVDPDIDMNMGSWMDNLPRHTHGTLVERDILTKGDPLNPPRKGAVLTHMNRFTRASLESGSVTSPTVLSAEQEIFYILGGEGIITDGITTADLRPGIAVLMPPGLSFTMKNTGKDALTMYLVCEPVPEGFTPNKAMKVVDEMKEPYRGSDGHWSHIVKELFMQDDGLATLEAFLTVTYHPMTIGHPHSHDPYYGSEEVWTAIDGTSIAFIGKQIRHQPPGTAYNIPPDGNTPHSNINTSGEPVRLLYFAVGAGALGSGERFQGPVNE